MRCEFEASKLEELKTFWASAASEASEAENFVNSAASGSAKLRFRHPPNPLQF